MHDQLKKENRNQLQQTVNTLYYVCAVEVANRAGRLIHSKYYISHMPACNSWFSRLVCDQFNPLRGVEKRARPRKRGGGVSTERRRKKSSSTAQFQPFVCIADTLSPPGRMYCAAVLQSYVDYISGTFLVVIRATATRRTYFPCVQLSLPSGSILVYGTSSSSSGVLFCRDGDICGEMKTATCRLYRSLCII